MANDSFHKCSPQQNHTFKIRVDYFRSRDTEIWAIIGRKWATLKALLAHGEKAKPEERIYSLQIVCKQSLCNLINWVNETEIFFHTFGNIKTQVFNNTFFIVTPYCTYGITCGEIPQ